ncbi:uncharacterized protein [Watersipora subatra]|uniref:uncharacterized protein n=1 Tax=Watersipora subatra TaxID=2589382 RepID=UPI00355B5203
MPQHLTKEKRAAIIHRHQQGNSQREIAKEEYCSKKSVFTTICRWKEPGQVEEMAGRGRKKLATDRVTRRLVRISLVDRHPTSPLLASELKESIGTELAPSTVCKSLRDNGLRGCKARRKPLSSSQQKKARLQWAKDHVNWSPEDWRAVLFSDESTFTVQNHSGNNYVRRRPGEEFKPECILPTIKHPTSLKVDQKNVDQKKVDQKKVDQKKVDQKKVDQKKVDQKKVDQKKVDQKKVDQKNVDQKKV